MLRIIFRSAVVWAILGLASGVYWREVTKFAEYDGATQLSTAHTHALALGMTILLVVLSIAKVFGTAEKRTTLFVILWNVGVGLTFGVMIVKGSFQAFGVEFAASPMWSGIAGLGHMITAGALVFLFVIVRRALKTAEVPEGVAV